MMLHVQPKARKKNPPKTPRYEGEEEEEEKGAFYF